MAEIRRERRMLADEVELRMYLDAADAGPEVEVEVVGSFFVSEPRRAEFGEKLAALVEEYLL